MSIDTDRRVGALEATVAHLEQRLDQLQRELDALRRQVDEKRDVRPTLALKSKQG